MGRFEGRVAIVTGAGRERGIGEAIATRIASDGGDVAIVDRGRQREGSSEKFGDLEEIQTVAARIASATGRKAIAYAADLTDEREIAAMVEKVASAFGRIDILFNNASAAGRGGPVENVRITDLDRESWDYAFSATLTSAFLCSKHVAARMIEAGRGGAIINTITGAAFRGTPGAGAYSASKLAVTALTRTLAVELAAHRIRVNAFSPGMVATQWLTSRFDALAAERGGTGQEMLARMGEQMVPLGRIGEPAELAAVACFLASDDASYVTGQIINVDGGSSAR